MRLIDAERLKKDVEDFQDCYNGFSDTYDKAFIIGAIDEQPTIDAVEVVRCKDCRHWSNGDDTYGICYRCPNTRQMRYDDYCSYGERGETD